MNIPIFFYSNKQRLLANGYDFSISEEERCIVINIVDLIENIKYEWNIDKSNNMVLTIDTPLYKQIINNNPDEEHPTTTRCEVEYNYYGKQKKGYHCCRVFNFDSKGVKFQTTKTNTSEKWVMGGYYDLPNNNIIFFGGKDNQWPKIEITKKESQLEIEYHLGNDTEEKKNNHINSSTEGSISRDDIILLIQTLRNDYNDNFIKQTLEELEALVSEMEFLEELERLCTISEKFNESPLSQANVISRFYIELAEIATKMNKCFAEEIAKEPQYHEFDAKTNVESLQALIHILKEYGLRLVDSGEDEWVIEDSNLNRVLSSQDFDIFYAPRLSQEDQVQKKLK